MEYEYDHECPGTEAMGYAWEGMRQMRQVIADVTPEALPSYGMLLPWDDLTHEEKHRAAEVLGAPVMGLYAILNIASETLKEERAVPPQRRKAEWN